MSSVQIISAKWIFVSFHLAIAGLFCVCVCVVGRVHVFRPKIRFTSLIGSGSDQEAGNPDSSPGCSLAPGIFVFLRVEVGG